MKLRTKDRSATDADVIDMLERVARKVERLTEETHWQASRISERAPEREEAGRPIGETVQYVRNYLEKRVDNPAEFGKAVVRIIESLSLRADDGFRDIGHIKATLDAIEKGIERRDDFRQHIIPQDRRR